MDKTPFTHFAVAPTPEHAPVLDAEKLQVYAVAVSFHAAIAGLAGRADAVVRDQLRRASLSIVLNIAEGAGQRSRPQKRRFYAIARGSAMECAAVLDILRAGGIADIAEHRNGRASIVRIVQMLTKLDRSLS